MKQFVSINSQVSFSVTRSRNLALLDSAVHCKGISLSLNVFLVVFFFLPPKFDPLVNFVELLNRFTFSPLMFHQMFCLKVKKGQFIPQDVSDLSCMWPSCVQSLHDEFNLLGGRKKGDD